MARDQPISKWYRRRQATLRLLSAQPKHSISRFEVSLSNSEEENHCEPATQTLHAEGPNRMRPVVRFCFSTSRLILGALTRFWQCDVLEALAEDKPWPI